VLSPELVVAVGGLDVLVVARPVRHVTRTVIRDVEDRGFDIEAASTVNQKR